MIATREGFARLVFLMFVQQHLTTAIAALVPASFPRGIGRNVQGMIAICAINGRRRVKVVGQESRRAQKEVGLQVHLSPAQ